MLGLRRGRRRHSNDELLGALGLVAVGAFGLLGCEPCLPNRTMSCTEHRQGMFDELGHGTLHAIRGAGCLDLGFRGHGDLLDIFLGNSCEHPVPVHVGRLRVWGVGAEGVVPVRIDDPRNELARLHIDTNR